MNPKAFLRFGVADDDDYRKRVVREIVKVLCFAPTDVAPPITLLEERSSAFDLAAQHLPGYGPGLGDDLDLAVDTDVVLLVIPLKQPTVFFVYDPANNAD